MSSNASAEAVHTRWNDIEVEQLSPVIGRQFIVGSGMMIARVLLSKGAVVPMHQHHNEQITYILEGALEFTVGGSQVVVRAGEVLCIPPNVPHEARALEDTVDLDVFNPPRQDWINRDDAYLRRAEPARS
jgi:quercetin dioxygenase-like cupin family protein